MSQPENPHPTDAADVPAGLHAVMEDAGGASVAAVPDLDEARLVRECLNGSAGASRDFVRVFTKRIYNFVYQMTRQQQDAEDITQQTFIKAFKNLHRFDTDRPLANWLFTIARRTALNHFRSEKRMDEMPAEIPSHEPSPASVAERRDAIDNLWEEARRVLSKREFEILWLRFGENLSVEETAEVTGLTRTHVKVITHRARNQLMERQAAL